MHNVKKITTKNTRLVRWKTRIISLIKKIKGNPKIILKVLKMSFSNPPSYILMRLLSLDGQNERKDFFALYQKFFKKTYPSDIEIKKMRILTYQLKNKPLISILMPVYNPPIRFLKEAIDSVLNQAYQNWEFCIADDNSSNLSIKKVIKEYAQKDKRIKYIFREKNGHISAASNSALELASGEYVALLDHDDILWPNALFEVVQMLQKNYETDLIYSDEDKLMENGTTHIEPFFKPNWSPDYLRSVNYITHFAVLKRKLVKEIGGFRTGYEGAQDWDLFLRISHKTKNIIHIPKILYSWRISPNSTASTEGALNAKKYAYQNQKKVLESDLKTRHNLGEIQATEYLGIWRTKYAITAKPLVSIIIPTKDKLTLLQACIESIHKKSTYNNYEIIIIDTGSTDKGVWDFYNTLSNKLSVYKWTDEFNFSSVCNFGGSKAKGEYFLFLNNDTEVISKDWIEGLLEHAQRKEIGAVGCKLLYPNKKIQHLGGLLGITGDPNEIGIGGHAFRGTPDGFRHFDRLAIKNYSFVTGACLMISKKKFEKVGGFDPMFQIAFNDIDFCLKLYIKHGLYNLVNPFVELYHKESASLKSPGENGRSVEQWKKEIKLFLQRWNYIRENDPFNNPNFSLNTENFDLFK